MGLIDIRQRTQRAYPEQKPFWVTSGDVKVEHANNDLLAISFPAVYGVKAVLIHDICFDVVAAFDGSAAINVGAGTIATEKVSTGGTLTVVDADDYIPTASITEATIGVYFPAAGDFVTAKAAGTNAAPQKIVCADATVPVIYIDYDATNPTTGLGRLHALISAIRMT